MVQIGMMMSSQGTKGRCVGLIFSLTAAIEISTAVEVGAASAIAYCRLEGTKGVATINQSADILTARNEAKAICEQDVKQRVSAGAKVLNGPACCGIKVFSKDDSQCIALAEDRNGSYRVGVGRNPKEASGEAVLRCGGDCTVPVRSSKCGEERR